MCSYSFQPAVWECAGMEGEMLSHSKPPTGRENWSYLKDCKPKGMYDWEIWLVTCLYSL